MRHFTILLGLLLTISSTGVAVEDADFREGEESWNQESPYRRTINFESDIGILMTPVGFGTQMTLYQYLSSFFQVGQSFQYFRNDDGPKEDHDLHYGVDLRMRVAPFQDYLFAPFAAVSVGYNRWQDEGVTVESPRVSYDLGMNIQLTRFFSLLMTHQDISFVNEVPKQYWGRPVNLKTFKSNDVMLTFSLDDSMF